MTIKLGIIDLFCGAGGTTTGFENTPGCQVIACVNHDDVAIASHKANHPRAQHFVEKIQHIEMKVLVDIVARFRAQYPDALVLLWASLECTNFSKAKGGLPRDGDSRSLADFMPWYVEALRPDYVGIENVMEFMSWGPLDENGKPISKSAGSDYLRWVRQMKALNQGYKYDWKQLNAADFGAYTSRKRFFAWFAHKDLPIVWPLATHCKATGSLKQNLFDIGLQPWKAVRDVLDLEDKGQSIFGRKKDLSEKTLARIYAGLIKFVAGGKESFLLKYNSINGKTGKYVPPDQDEPSPVVSTQGRLALCHVEFIAKYFSGNPESKVISTDGPAGTITTSDHHSLVQCNFLTKYYSGRPDNKLSDLNEPSGTIRTKDVFSLVSPEFISAYYGNGDNCHSGKVPSPTIRTKDGVALVQPQFIQRDFSRGDNNKSLNTPSGSLLPNPKENLVTAEPFVVGTNYDGNATDINKPCPTITANRKWHYLINPQWFNTNTQGIDQPCYTLIARMDKTPAYLVETEEGFLAIEILETDSEMTVKMKEFMAMYGLWDIKMRMLKINELLKIQGFPAGYVLKGTQTQQKKFIGNSVVPVVITSMAQCLIEAFTEHLKVA